MAREVLKLFEGYCPVNDCPKHFSVTYVERDDGKFERRDDRDCDYKGLFNPSGCVNCDLVKSVKQVYEADEMDKPVDEYPMNEKIRDYKMATGSDEVEEDSAADLPNFKWERAYEKEKGRL